MATSLARCLLLLLNYTLHSRVRLAGKSGFILVMPAVVGFRVAGDCTRMFHRFSTWNDTADVAQV